MRPRSWVGVRLCMRRRRAGRGRRWRSMMRGRKRSRCWELSMGTGCGTVLGEVIDWEKSIVYPIIQHWWLGMGVCTTDRFNRGGSHQCSYRYINRGKNTPVAWLSVNFVGWLFWHRSPNYELRAARAKATLQSMDASDRFTCQATCRLWVSTTRRTRSRGSSRQFPDTYTNVAGLLHIA